MYFVCDWKRKGVEYCVGSYAVYQVSLLYLVEGILFREGLDARGIGWWGKGGWGGGVGFGSETGGEGGAQGVMGVVALKGDRDVGVVGEIFSEISFSRWGRVVSNKGVSSRSRFSRMRVQLRPFLFLGRESKGMSAMSGAIVWRSSWICLLARRPVGSIRWERPCLS